MNIDRTNHWIAIVANIGVIASVAFLAFEIQQNTQTNRAQAVQEFHRDMRDSLLNPNERMADILHRVYACEPVSIVELNMRRLYWERLIRTYENQWYQKQQGLIDQGIYEGYQSYWRITVGWGDRDWWPPSEGIFHPDFVQAMSDYLDKHGRGVPGTFSLLNREKCTDLGDQ
jgi:hypothetical protein